MTSITAENAKKALLEMPARGPGGAAAVLKDGELLDYHVWGYANLDERIPMTDTTIFPICSISKQMLCATLHHLDQTLLLPGSQPGDFKAKLQQNMPNLLPAGIAKDTNLTIDHLCDNQSGIRDYWCLGTLFGAHPESKFSLTDHVTPMIEKLQSFHFEPGTQYSYANTNFNIVARLMERLTGKYVGDLIAEQIFEQAGMRTAKLIADTAKQPPPCVGYEGTELSGYFPANNNIEWAGDAGITASLVDMIAYEKYFDTNWNSGSSWAKSAGNPVSYTNGRESKYRMGLTHWNVEGTIVVGHGGALRGYRLNRLYAPQQRISVVVMFNHEQEPVGATEFVLKQLLNLPKPGLSEIEPAEGWKGAFIDDISGLAVVVAPAKGKISISMVGAWEGFKLVEPNLAETPNARFALEGDTLHIERLVANFTASARRLKSSAGVGLDSKYAGTQGKYYCKEIDSTLNCTGDGGMLYANFDGFMGKGPPHLMRHLGENVWLMACPRGMDARPPGDWTMVFDYKSDGKVTGLTIGCWLARKLKYTRVN